MGLSSIKRISTKIQDACKSKSIDYLADIITNGYLLNPGTFSNLIDLGITRFTITIDGLAEFHNARRPLKGGKPTFDRIAKNLRAIANLEGKFTVMIETNFDKDSVKSLPNFLRWFQINFGGDHRFFIYFRSTHSSGSDEEDKKISFCSLEERNQTILKLLDWSIKNNMNQFLRNSIFSWPRSSYCEAQLPNYFIIQPDGSVSKCTAMMGPEDRVGWLKKSGEIEFNKKPHHYLSLSYPNDEECLQCIFLPVCHGGCPIVRDKGRKVCMYSIPLAKKALEYIYHTKMKKGK